MCSWKQEYSILVCLAGFLVASIGWLLSVLATLITKYLGEPGINIETRAAATASTRSTTRSNSLRDKAASARSPTRRARPNKLLIDVKGPPEARSQVEEVEMTLSPLDSPDAPGPGPTAIPTVNVNVVRFLTPTHRDAPPTIAISPPPTRLSHRSHLPRRSEDSHTHRSEDSRTHRSEDSHASTSTDSSNTRYSQSSSSSSSQSGASSVSSPPPELRGRRRSRLSKIVHLFADKREKRLSRRLSLPELQTDTPADKPLPLSPPSEAPSHITEAAPSLSPVASPPPSSPPARSRSVTNKGPRRHRSLMLRVASCPLLHHAHTQDEPCPVSPRHAADPKPCPCPLSPKHAAADPKPPAPRPRTQPYAAPYFIPPPDSADAVEPAVRRRPSRRRTTPSERKSSGSVPPPPVPPIPREFSAEPTSILKAH